MPKIWIIHRSYFKTRKNIKNIIRNWFLGYGIWCSLNGKFWIINSLTLYLLNQLVDIVFMIKMTQNLKIFKITHEIISQRKYD